MSDFVGLFLHPSHQLDGIVAAAACGFGTPESLRAGRREADKLLREVELFRQRLDSTSGWPVPPPGATFFVPRPGREWEQGKDAAEWQLAFRQAIDGLIAEYRSVVEECFRLSPGPFPGLAADEATQHNYQEAVRLAMERYHLWQGEIARLRNHLHQFRNDMASFAHQTPPVAPATSPPPTPTLTNPAAISPPALNPAAAPQTAGVPPDDGLPLPRARHSLDFRSVHWFGTGYDFNEAQAAIVAVLWDAWQQGTPSVGHRTLLAAAEVEYDRLPDVFKVKGQSHPAWGTMIQSNVGSKGEARLCPPDAARS